MKTQTKCTLFLSGMLIIEILPIPLTSIFSLYIVRRRPQWLPGVVERLYAEKEIKHETTLPQFDEKKSIVTRRRCTISLSLMIILDFLIPFTILTGLYVTRRRPIWFKNTASRLYADKLITEKKTDHLADGKLDHAKILENRLTELQQSNNEFVLNIANKNKAVLCD